MKLGDVLQQVARDYDRRHDKGQLQPAAVLLRMAVFNLASYKPFGWQLEGKSGMGDLPFIPWIALYPPGQKPTAKEGIYLVYLVAGDKKTIYLTLLEGSENLRQVHGLRNACAQLRAEAQAIRERLDLAADSGLLTAIDLHAEKKLAPRPRAYEAGVIVAKRYSADAMPHDDVLREDLRNLTYLCLDAISARAELKLEDPELIQTPEPEFEARKNQPRRPSGLREGPYNPKSDSNTRRRVGGGLIIAQRTHETLVNSFATHAEALGYETSNPHPIDLKLRKGPREWIVEAKVLEHPDGLYAARAALGQLLWYRHVYHSPPRSQDLLALFNDSPSEANLNVLLDFGIESVWRNGHNWLGTAGAPAADGLAS